MAFPVKTVTRPAVLNGLTNGKLPDSALVAVPGTRLVASAARAFVAMRDAAARDGITLDPTSAADGYRPYAVQEAIFRQRYRVGAKSSDVRTWNGQRWGRVKGAAAAVPGTSNHGWGLAVDIANASGARLKWLLANADRFGFSWELQSEPWHLRYYRGDDGVPSAPAPASPAAGATSVRDIQTLLSKVGLYGGAIDGINGPATTAAIKVWQTKLGITADGKWGPITQAKTEALFRLLAAQAQQPTVDLAGIARAIDDASKQTLRKGSRGDAVRWCQALVNNKLGAGTLVVDGDYGDRTAWFVGVFQGNTAAFLHMGDNAFQPRGTCGPDTWFFLRS